MFLATSVWGGVAIVLSREKKSMQAGGGVGCLSSNITGLLSLFLLTKFPSTNVSSFAVPLGPFPESCFSEFS